MSDGLRQMDNTLCLKTGTILKLQSGHWTESGGGICHLGGNGGKLFGGLFVQLQILLLSLLRSLGPVVQ